MAEPTPEVGPPEGWDNFANNLGSDLAPLLALFGEQVTKQYLSESLSGLDCLLFAFAPLGIITAMVAAIRVAGEPWLRALIGRAKEGRGEVEADLMSSTSSDVCELWNGDGIVRVLGRPALLQLICVGPTAAAVCPPGLYTFHEAVRRGIYTAGGCRSGGPASAPGGGLPPAHIARDPEADADSADLHARQNPPNLSLNVSVKPVDRRLLIFFALVGFLVQSGVLAWAAFSQYGLELHKNDAPPAPYGFAIFAAGTVVLALGMFGCAWAVESSTSEAVWQPAAGAPRAMSVLWLQQGGQIVGDQRFESWSRRSVYPDNSITTSHKSAKTLALIQSAPGNGGINSRNALVNTAVTLAFLGFVLQFFGLRVLHSSVTLAQLGAILLMTLIRSFGHIQRDNRNDIKAPEEVEGHELDWLAKDLTECTAWEVITGPIYADTSAVPSSAAADATAATEVMKTRASLAKLSQGWELDIQATAKILCRAIEMTMNDVFANMTLAPAFQNGPVFKWVVPVRTVFQDQPRTSEVVLLLSRERDDENNWRPWTIGASELEAVLSLWVSTLTDVNRTRRLRKVRLLGLATEGVKVDHKIWIHRGTTTVETALKHEEARYFGRVTGSSRESNPTVSGSNPSAEYLSVEAKGSLEMICAQELHTSFLFQLLGKVDDVGGITTRRTDDSTAAVVLDTSAGNQSWSQFRLSNSNLSTIARVYDECGLGTVEDAYLCIVPAFRSANKLPSPHAAYYEARKACTKLAADGEWAKAFEIDSWLYTSSKKTNVSKGKVKAITAEIGGRLRSASEKLVADCESAAAAAASLDEGARRVWSSAYALCRTIAEEASEDLVIALLNLYKICGNIKPSIAGADADAVFRLAFQVAKGSQAKGHTTIEMIRSLYLLRLPAVSVDEIDKYLSDAKSLKAAAEAQVSGLDDDDVLVPIDLRLAQGHRTPLQMAAEMGHRGIVETLLRAGANVNDAGAEDDGRTALAAAAGGGHKEVVEMLLAAHADVNARAESEGRTGNRGQTALQAAAGGGHTEVVRILLRVGADCNAPSASHGRTALQAAARGGHTDIVKMLLDLGADINASLMHGFEQTAMEAAAEGGYAEIVVLLLAAGADLASLPERPGPLQIATRGGHKEVVKLLLAAGADVNAPCTPRDLNALQTAAEGGDKELVRILLDAGANFNVNTEPGPEGRAVLEVAAAAGHREVVEMLLAAGADPNPERSYTRTPLEAAAGSGHGDIVQILIAAGAPIYTQLPNIFGETAFKVAARGGHLEVIAILVAASRDTKYSYPEARSVMEAAAEGGHSEVVELLLTTYPGVHARPTDGKNSLIGVAAARGHEKLVEVLIKAGLDVNHRGPETALKLAAAGGHKGVVKLLLDARADVNSKESSSALQAAAEGGHDEVVELLLEAGANIRPEIHGRRSLEVAAGGGHDEVVKLLLKTKADVDSLSTHAESKWTALQSAAGGGHLEAVKLVLGAGANVNVAAGAGGRTALQAAAEGGHAEVVHFLLAFGADINAIGAERVGKTALQAASEAGRLEVVKLLLAGNPNAPAPPRYGTIALKGASEKGHGGVIELLLAAGVDVNSKDDGTTALQVAAAAGQVEVVKALLAAGAKVDDRGRRDDTKQALKLGEYAKYPRIVKLLEQAIIKNSEVGHLKCDELGKRW